MKPRRGFTLLEISVALVITALVVSLAYAASQAGIDTEGRLEVHRSKGESLTSVRALVGDALRHAVQGVRGGPPTFEIVRRPSLEGDSIAFQTRGIVPPLGTSQVWTASLYVKNGVLTFQAWPTHGGETVHNVVAKVHDIATMRVQTLGRAQGGTWSDQWDDPSVTPQAVRIELSSTAGTKSNDLEPLIGRIGLERMP